jgi:hypothetical protein
MAEPRTDAGPVDDRLLRALRQQYGYCGDDKFGPLFKDPLVVALIQEYEDLRDRAGRQERDLVTMRRSIHALAQQAAEHHNDAMAAYRTAIAAAPLRGLKLPAAMVRQEIAHPGPEAESDA